VQEEVQPATGTMGIGHERGLAPPAAGRCRQLARPSQVQDTDGTAGEFQWATPADLGERHDRVTPQGARCAVPRGVAKTGAAK
jgi:hypothetical protein